MINTDPVPSGGLFAVIEPQDSHAIFLFFPIQVFVVGQVVTLASLV
jgi:hypothetical protein